MVTIMSEVKTDHPIQVMGYVLQFILSQTKAPYGDDQVTCPGFVGL